MGVGEVVPKFDTVSRIPGLAGLHAGDSSSQFIVIGPQQSDLSFQIQQQAISISPSLF